MQQHNVLDRFVGRWRGKCRTWFEPGVLADEADVEGEFSPVFGGRLFRHAYTGTIQGKARRGEDLLAFNKTAGLYQSAWIDDFHMSSGILFSEGKAMDDGFSVLGHYDVGEGHPKWGWRTEFRMAGDNRLTITAFNIMPGEREAKAVETVYDRVG